MVSFNDIEELFALDLHKKFCIEIEFFVKEHPKYQSCWMGKMPDKNTNNKDIYWYGLIADGSESYDYDNFQDFFAAPVFDGKTIKEMWKHIELLSIDGCNPAKRMCFYLK